MPAYDAVAFDLLTGLLDSWTLWNDIAGGPEAGLQWRREYLRLTYGAGKYRPYEDLVAEAARATGLSSAVAAELARRWTELQPWSEAREVLHELAVQVPLAVVTNCPERLARMAVELTGCPFAVTVSSERAGWYKPQPQPYELTLSELGVAAGRVLFVAGSSYDIAGASNVGMAVFWHNRIALPVPESLDLAQTHLVATADSLWPLIPLVLADA